MRSPPTDPPISDAAPPAGGAALWRLAPLIVLVVAGLGFVILGGGRYLSFATLARNHDRFAALAARWGVVAGLVYGAAYAGATALSLPGAAILTVAGGYLFGTFPATIYAVAGATAGATLVFVAARAGLGGLARRAGPFARRLEAGFRRDAFNYLLFLRLVVLFPFWLVNLVPAVLGMRLRSYVLATAIGIAPGTLAYASLGDSLGSAGAGPYLAIAFQPKILLPLLGLAIFALLPVAYRHRKGGA